jgi:heat shock protein HtpX
MIALRQSTHVRTIGLLVALIGLTSATGAIAFGRVGALFGLLVTLLIAAGHYVFSSALQLRLRGALPLSYWQAPSLHQLVARLAERARINPPQLYLIPSSQPNALAAGSGRGQPVLAVTEGLLNMMSRRELAAVLAHEVAHLKNDDTTLHQIAVSIGQFTISLLKIGIWVSLFLSLFWGLPALAKALLLAVLALFAPAVIHLLVSALSRAREFAADKTAAELTGAPHALASALGRLERRKRTWLSYFFYPPAEATVSSTHPPTAERIGRLLAMQPSDRPLSGELVYQLGPHERIGRIARYLGMEALDDPPHHLPVWRL